jgi:hypothetical protein
LAFPVFECSEPFPKSPFLSLALLLTDTTSEDSRTPDPGNGGGNPEPDTRLYFFATQGQYNGNLGGISGADLICENEKENQFPDLPGNGSTYKAFLVDGVNRIACANLDGNCTTTTGSVDWVLQPNREYFRSDGASLFTTNSGGIFPFSGPGDEVLAVPFTTNSADRFWTGLFDDFTVDIDLCEGPGPSPWSSDSSAGFGMVGEGNSRNRSSIHIEVSYAVACNMSARILCVRQ